MADPSSSVIARNPSAGRDFIFLETFEAGIELNGAEVKSLRSGRVNMKEAFARIDEGQIFLYGLDISPWPQSAMRQEPKRPRRLLLHREQIERLRAKMSGKGLTITAIKIYFKKALVKVEIALAQGKKQYDRREDIKKREADIEISRALKHDVRRKR
jgi:SsrA-binding protein